MKFRTASVGVAAVLTLAALASACGSTSSSSSATSAAAAPSAIETTPDSSSSASTSTASTSSEPIKAAFIYVGPHNDGGWSQSHDEGRLYAQQKLGSKVITTFKESVPEGPQANQVIEDLIKDGNKIIFATSFGYQDALVAEAKKHPDVKFEQSTGSLVTPNLSEYYGAGEEGMYLGGMAAAAATKSNKIGMVAAFATPEVLRQTSAFELGVQAVNPKAVTKVVWTNAWFAPDKEKKAAENLISAGSDVLAQSVDSPTTGQVAEAKGVPWVGYDSDARKFAPKSFVTALLYHWGPYYLKRISEVADGSWKSGFYYGSFADRFLSLAPFGPSVTAATKAKIAAKEAEMKAGSFSVFRGPIVDQSGKVRIAAGKKATIDELYAMDYLVKGVEGSAKG